MKKQRGIFEKIPGSGVWWIRYTCSDKRYRREKVGPYSLASQLLIKRRGDAQRGEKLGELRRRVTSFEEIASDAVAWSKEHKRSYRDDANRMKRLVEWWGKRNADSIDGHEMEQTLSDAARAEHWKPSTFNHYRSLLMLTYKRARKSGKVRTNPARDIEHRKEDNERVRYFEQYKLLPTEIEYLKPCKGEEARLRTVIQHEYPEHVAEFELAASTALRMSSVYGLTWEMIDWENRMVNLPTSKNGKSLHLPLNAAAIIALQSVRQSGEQTGRIFCSQKTGKALQNWRHWMPKAIKLAGLQDFRPHDLRHCFASKLRMKGAKLEDIGELLGHKSLMMTKRYAHLGPDQLHGVAALSDSTTTAPAPVKSPTHTDSVSSKYVN